MLGLARRRGRGWAPAQPPLAAASVLAAPASVLSTPAVTIRPAFPDDAQALARLAALDSAQSPPGPVLVAEVDGELRAALSIADGSIVADPFHRTAALLELLSARAAQLARSTSASSSSRAGGALSGRARSWRAEGRRAEIAG